MSGWNCERQATDEDRAALKAAATRFAARRGWKIDQGLGIVDIVNMEIDALRSNDPAEGSRVDRLWIKCVRRALDSKIATGIAWDAVGYHAKE